MSICVVVDVSFVMDTGVEERRPTMDSTSDDNRGTTTTAASTASVIRVETYEAEMFKTNSPQHGVGVGVSGGGGGGGHPRYHHRHHAHHVYRNARFWKRRAINDRATFGETVVALCHRCIHFLRKAWTGVRMTIGTSSA